MKSKNRSPKIPTKTQPKIDSFPYFKSMHKRFSVQHQKRRNKTLSNWTKSIKKRMFLKKTAVSHMCWHQKQNQTL